MYTPDKDIELETHVVLIEPLEERTRKFLDRKGESLFTRSIAIIEVVGVQFALSKAEYAKVWELLQRVL
jgi:hypothetical protein